MFKQGNLIYNNKCFIHKKSLQYACIEKYCYLNAKQICIKCVSTVHYNHSIVDLSILSSKIDKLKYQLMSFSAKFESLYKAIQLSKYSKSFVQAIEESYIQYKKDSEQLIYKIIYLSFKLEKCEEYNYSNSVINKAINLVGKIELIQFYFIQIPNKWIKNLKSKLKKQTFESLNQSDILICYFDHYKFKQQFEKKIDIGLLCNQEIKLSKIRENQLAIIQLNSLFVLDQEQSKSRLFQYVVDSNINKIFQQKKKQHILIFCGNTQQIQLNNKIFSVTNDYLQIIKFQQNKNQTILKRIYMKGITNILIYDNYQMICQVSENSFHLFNTNNLKITSTYQSKYCIEQIMCFNLKNEVILFSSESLICINLLLKKQFIKHGQYSNLKIKKLDESHYSLWSDKLVEVFDIFNSHIKPVISLRSNIIDIELVQDKIFFYGTDNLIHVYK